MLRDRFREWHFPLKYNRARRDQRSALVSSAFPIASEERHLTATLSVVGSFLDELSSTGSWSHSSASQGLEIQRLAASAHMAISTYSSNCPARYAELVDLGDQTADAMFRCRNATTMHPRVLTALQRLLIDNRENGVESDALALVKKMFQVLADRQLPKQHPVRLLCHMKKDQAVPLLKRMSTLTEQRFYDKISTHDPDFAAQEQIYSARVLASIGHTQDAIDQLKRMLAKYDGGIDVFTIADANRTLGYANSLSGSLDEARRFSLSALQSFEKAGASGSENSMYTHMCLVRVHGRPGTLLDLGVAEHHARAAVSIWEANAASNKGKGGIMWVKDLHRILCEQEKTEEAKRLRTRFPTYFEEVAEAKD